MQATWDDLMGQMCAFVNDTNADVDMAYDWVCEMLDISSFVDNEIAWNSFYNCWESCDNRNDLNTFQIVWFLTLFHFTFFIMFQHKLPNGNIIMHEGLPRDLAIKRMEDEARWVQEHREELNRDSQQLFDDMFGG